MKFTDKEIKLAKELKELGFPQEVEEGDWIFNEEELILIKTPAEAATKLFASEILLPSLSACLEWLRENGWRCLIHETPRERQWVVYAFIDEKGSSEKGQGDNLLAACLAAIKAILEGEHE